MDDGIAVDRLLPSTLPNLGRRNDWQLTLVESIEHLQGRFRQVEVILKNEANLPPSLPGAWLNPEVAGRTVRFDDSEFTEANSRNVIQSEFANSEVLVHPMSLREIFVALARAYRLSGCSGQWLP